MRNLVRPPSRLIRRRSHDERSRRDADETHPVRIAGAEEEQTAEERAPCHNHRVKGYVKAAVVIAGYVVAFAIAWGAVALHMATTNQAEASAASGMYAFGDLLLFVAVFGVLALIPTGAALFFVFGRFFRG